MLAVLAVIVAGALIVATHVAVDLEHRVAARTLDRQRAFAAAEHGLWTTVADWNEAAATMPRGGATTRVMHVLRDSAVVTTVRLNDELYWVTAEAVVGDARRRTGVNVRAWTDSSGLRVERVRRSWVEVH